MNTGIKVVGAPGGIDDTATLEEAPRDAVGPDDPSRAGGSGAHRRNRTPELPRRRRLSVTGVLAVVGLAGTLVFGVLWAGSSGSGQTDPALKSAAQTFLLDLTNFNAKSVDTNFGSITAMATGPFASQATRFFNSSIRHELETALAESRWQIRDLEVQSDNGSTGSVYAVVDQVFANNKITTPQSDVLRVLVSLQKVQSTWKISDVTVLEGATPGSTGSPSGSAGSSVPGQ